MAFQADMNVFVGRRVVKNIYNRKGTLLFPAHSMMNDTAVRLMTNHQIFLSEQDVETDSGVIVQTLRQTETEAKAIFAGLRNREQIPYRILKQKIVQPLRSLSRYVQVFGYMLSMRASDEYTYQHSMSVGLIAAMLGVWMKLPDEEITQLVSAAVLHDLGKLQLSPDILHKPGRLTAEEFEHIKHHAKLGYELLADQGELNPRIAVVALQHHEREDGSGYPYGLKSGQIDPWSKIVAVADVFHAMTSKRVYRDELPLYDVLRHLWESSYETLDPRAVYFLVNRLMLSMIGCRVELSGGAIGNIVGINENDPIRPLVHIEADDRFIDLSKERGWEIAKLVRA